MKKIIPPMSRRSLVAGASAISAGAVFSPSVLRAQALELKIGYMRHPVQESSAKMFDDFGMKNNIKITKIPMAYEVFMEKVTTNLVNGGDQFDIIWHNDDWGQLWKKWLEPTDDLSGMANVYKPTVDIAFLNDDKKPTVVPMVHTFGVFMYRTDLISPDQLPKTWDDMVAIGKRLQAEGKVKWGYVGSMAMNHSWFTWFWSCWANNCDILAPAYERDSAKLAAGGWTPMLADPKHRQVVEFWWDTMNTHKISPPGMLAYTRNDANAIFQAGDAAFCVADLTLFGLFNDPAKSRAAGKIGIAPLPLGPSRSEPVAWNDIWGWAIPKGVPADRKNAAKRLLNGMLNDDAGQTRLWKETGGPPPNVKLWEEIAKADPLFKRCKEVVFDVKQVIAGGYYTPQWPAAHKAYSDAVVEAVKGPRNAIPDVLGANVSKVREAFAKA
jgi:multiple sugar transport system substrate-binding protein